MEPKSNKNVSWVKFWAQQNVLLPNIHTYNLDVKNDFLPTNMILKKYACLVCQIIHLKSNKFIFKIILLLKFVYPFVIHIKSKLINISNWKHGTNDKHCVKSGVNKGLSRVDRILGRKTTSHLHQTLWTNFIRK